MATLEEISAIEHSIKEYKELLKDNLEDDTLCEDEYQDGLNDLEVLENFFENNTEFIGILKKNLEFS